MPQKSGNRFSEKDTRRHAEARKITRSQHPASAGMRRRTMSRRASSASSRALANNLRCGGPRAGYLRKRRWTIILAARGLGVCSDAACLRVNDIIEGREHEKIHRCDRADGLCRHRRRAGADLSVASDHARRAVPAGRIDRRGRAHHGRAHAAVARPAGHHRECRWRRRQHRGRPRRARGARRLHDRHRPVGHPCRQHHLSADLRSAEGFRADRADVDQSATHGRQEGAAGGRPEGARRLDEGQPRQDHLRQPERGRTGVRHPVRAGDRHEGSVHPLSRRRSGHDRI